MREHIILFGEPTRARYTPFGRSCSSEATSHKRYRKFTWYLVYKGTPQFFESCTAISCLCMSMYQFTDCNARGIESMGKTIFPAKMQNNHSAVHPRESRECSLRRCKLVSFLLPLLKGNKKNKRHTSSRLRGFIRRCGNEWVCIFPCDMHKYSYSPLVNLSQRVDGLIPCLTEDNRNILTV